MTAWIAGKAVSVEKAAAEAARLLRSARLPVVAGMATDVAGARAAIRLAEKLRGAYDHMASEALLRDLDVMRQAGLMVTTPNELRLRADCVLLVGTKLAARTPDLIERLALASPAHFDAAQAPRTIIRIGASRNDPHVARALDIAATAAALPQTLGCLAARVAGHRTRQPEKIAAKLDEAVERLKAARFGVVVWSAESLDPLSIETLYGMIKELNKTTRFTGLPIAAAMHGVGVQQTSGWMTGFPVRTGFGRGYPEHDSWRFDSARMIEAGETDIVVWISAYGAPPLPWRRQVPFIALATPLTRFAYSPRVQFDIGTPGQDHDGIELAPETATFVMHRAQTPSQAHRTAAVLGLIDESLTEGDATC